MISDSPSERLHQRPPKQQKTWQIPLRLVLIVPFVLQIVGAVGLVGYLSYRSGQKAVENMMDRLMSETADRIEQHLNSYLQAPQKVNQINLKAIESGIIDPQDFQRLGKFFWQELQNYDFTYINYGNQQDEFIGSGYFAGKIEIAEIKKPKITTLYSYQPDQQGDRTNPPVILEGENPNHGAWYAKAIEAGKPCWSPIYNWADVPEEVSISASAPVYNQSDQLLGVVGIDLSLSKISTFLKGLKVGKSGTIFIVERSGLLVANSTDQKPYKLVNGKAQRLSAQDIQNPLIQSTVQTIIKNFGDFRQIKNDQKFHLDQQKHYFQTLSQNTLTHIISYQDQYGLDWLIVVTLPQSDFMGEIQANNHRTVLLCFLTFFTATVIGIFTVRWITHPILQLNVASQAIARGERQAPLLENLVIAEIQTLTTSFNWMFEQIYQSLDHVKIALQESEEKFATIFRNCPDPIGILDIKNGQRFLDVNDRFLQVFEYNIAEVLGKTALELGIVIDPEQRLLFWQTVVATSKVKDFEFLYRSKSGKVGTMLLSAEVLEMKGKSILLIVAKDISDRKQIELALQRSETRFQKIAASSPGAIYIIVQRLDGSRYFEYMSSGVKELYEFSSQELLENFNLYIEQIHPDDLAGYQAAVAYSMAKLVRFYHEWRIITPSGKLKWIQARTRPECRENGEIAWYGFALDITDQKTIELALQASESKFQKIAASSPGVIYIIVQRPDGTRYFEYLNPAVEEIHEVTVEQLYKNCHIYVEQIHPDDLAGYEKAVAYSFANLSPFHYEWRIITPSKKLKWVQAVSRPERRENGDIARYGVLLDITDQIEFKNRLHRIACHIPGMIYQYRLRADGSSHFPYASDGIQQIYNVTPEDVIEDATPVFHVLHPDDLQYVSQSILESATKLIPWYCEYRVCHQDGQVNWVLGHATPQKQLDGSVIWHGYITDISDRKKIEIELLAAKKSAENATKAKGDFLANMSHEIRTPMNGVIGMTQLLALTKLTEKQQELVDTIKDSAEALLMIINDILDFSKIESGRLELEKHPFDLKHLIKSVCNLLTQQASKKNITIEYTIDPDVPTNCLGDSSRLRQILLNLIGNAIKFTETGGVFVSVMRHQAVSLVIEGNQTEHISQQDQTIELIITIKDTGIGIHRERLNKLFQPFTQGDASISRKYGGTGLGLVISKSLVNLMGGTIWVESLGNIGGNPPDNWNLVLTQTNIQGTIFYFTFGAKAVLACDVIPKGSSVEPQSVVISSPSTLKILLAEDNKVNQKVAILMLEKLGYHANIANNGLEVLEMIEKQFYDIILMDMQMPEMDGLAATKIIRQSSQIQPYIIALTANALEEDRQICLDMGMNDYISKPIAMAEITRALNKFSQKVATC